MAITDKQVVRGIVADAVRDYGRTQRLMMLADSYSRDARLIHDSDPTDSSSLMYVKISEALKAEFRDGKSNT